MKTVIYLDILLLVNFLIGYFMLLGAGKLSGTQHKHLLLGSALSALSTLIVLAPPLPDLVSAAYKLLTGPLIVLAAFGWQGRRPFGRVLCWFLLMNMGLAGVVLLAVTRGGFVNMQMNNLSVYINLPPSILVLSVLGMYCFVRIAVSLFGKPNADSLWELCAELPDNSSLVLPAFYDTGFFVRDPLGNAQVILVSWESAKGQLSSSLNNFLSDYFAGQSPLPPKGISFRLIPCQFAGGNALLPGIVVSSAVLTQKDEHCTARKPILLFCEGILRDGSFAALFGSEFLQ